MTVNVLGKRCAVRFDYDSMNKGVKLLESCDAMGWKIKNFIDHITDNDHAYVVFDWLQKDNVVVTSEYGMAVVVRQYPTIPVINFNTGEKLCVIP